MKTVDLAARQVRWLQAGSTEIRKIIDPQPPPGCQDLRSPDLLLADRDFVGFWTFAGKLDGTPMEYPIPCPFGEVGAKLDVREPLVPRPMGENTIAVYEADTAYVLYRDGAQENISGAASWQWRKRTDMPSRFMPSWARRYAIEITGLRVERLKEVDITAETAATMLIDDFAREWDAINKEWYRFELNPFVWVATYRRIK